MHVDGPAFPGVGEGPDGFHNLIPAQDNARIGHEIVEQVKFLNRQDAGLALYQYLVLFQVHENVPAHQGILVLGQGAAPA